MLGRGFIGVLVTDFYKCMRLKVKTAYSSAELEAVMD
jgi:hypothetical protein